MILTLIALAVGLSLALTVAWAVAVRSGQSGWIDATWSLSVGLAGIAASLAPFEAITLRQGVVAGLVGLWSLRLASHIAARTVGGGDDPRYAHLKKEWGVSFRGRLFWFLQIQAASALLLALAVMAAAHNPAPGLTMGDGLGIALFGVAWLGEAVADTQLRKFRADPTLRGGVCDGGLWGRSRHPNYFFEWLGWAAYAIVAIAPDPTYGWGWVALAGPIMMYWLLVYVSGIPLLEAHMLRSRGGLFADYQRRVSAFWPITPLQRR